MSEFTDELLADAKERILRDFRRHGMHTVYTEQLLGIMIVREYVIRYVEQKPEASSAAFQIPDAVVFDAGEIAAARKTAFAIRRATTSRDLIGPGRRLSTA